jgi:hypothetical protein
MRSQMLMKLYLFPKVLYHSRELETVIPAEAGIRSFQSHDTRDWTPAFAGVTGSE